jgi:gas vesicle protein
MKFIMGAAIGAVTTYIYKDEKAKQWLDETNKKLKEKAGSFKASFSKKPADEAAASATPAGEVIEGTVETTTTTAKV